MMTRPFVAFVLAVGLVAVGCSQSPPGPVDQHDLADPAKVGIPDLVKANNALAVDLYGQIRLREGNLFFSPTGIASGLAISSVGASGATLREIRKVLGIPGGSENLHLTWAAMLRDLNSGKKPSANLKKRPGGISEIRLANALWCPPGYPIADAVQQQMVAGFGTKVTPLDFQKAPDQARRRINDWVSEQTSGKISQVVGAGDLGSTTKLVLTSAIYFQGAWTETFSKEVTRQGNFHTSAERQTSVPLMNQTLTRARYADEGTFQALEMTYADQRFAMVVLLPREVEGWKELEAGLTSDRLNGVLARLAPTDEVIVTLPRFSLHCDLELDKTLSTLGMAGAFGPSADFSAMTGGSKNDLVLGRVAHAAMITVDEQGTEAAASMMVVSSDDYDAKPPKPIIFRADHPFVFLIVDRKSGAILFLGRLARPE